MARRIARAVSRLGKCGVFHHYSPQTWTDTWIVQARKAASLAEQYAPVDTDADAKLEREAREEERIITSTCDELGVKMFEVRRVVLYANESATKLTLRR